MRSFKLLLHSVIVILLLMGSFLLKSHYQSLLRTKGYPIPGGTQLLILGDSHARKNLDPSLFPAVVNQAQSAEFTYFSEAKLRAILRHAPRLRTVLISISYHSLGEFPLYEGAEMTRRYHSLLDTGFYREKLSREVPDPAYLTRWIGDHSIIPIGWLNDVAEYHLSRQPFEGEFEPAEGSVIGKEKSLTEALKRHYSYHGIPTGVSALKADYLRRIAKLCQAKGIRLIIVNTPVHPRYLRAVPQTHIRYTDSLAVSLSRYGAKYWNYSAHPFPDKAFYDYDHLNADGAKQFSRILAQRMAKGD